MGNEYLYWPGEVERRNIAERNQSFLGFPDLVGFIDGCQFDLHYAPQWKKNEFFNRKSQYSLNTVGVCDDTRKIRYLASGFHGSSHDMKCLTESQFHLNTESFFSGEQYVLGDGGYKPYHYLVPISRKPPRKTMTKSNEKFGTYIAMMRIKIEHSFGILKERLQSLKKIPTKIRNRKDMLKACRWIQVCVLINNFLLEQTDDAVTRRMKFEWDKKEEEALEKISRQGVVVPIEDRRGDGIEVCEDGKEKYKRIREIVLTHNGKQHLLDLEDDDNFEDEE